MFSIVDLKLFSYIFDSPLSFLSFLWDNKKSTSVWIEYELQILALFVSWTWRFLTFKTIKSWTVSNFNYLASKGHWNEQRAPVWLDKKLCSMGYLSIYIFGRAFNSSELGREVAISWACERRRHDWKKVPSSGPRMIALPKWHHMSALRYSSLFICSFIFLKRLQSVTEKLWQIVWVLSRIRDLKKRQVGRL